MNIDSHEFYQEEVGDRVITVCVGTRKGMNYHAYIGISIRHPIKEDREGLGKKIAFNRCEAAIHKEKRKRNNKMLKPIKFSSWKSFLKDDKFFLQQLAKSYFFHVKHNLENYIAGYETN